MTQSELSTYSNIDLNDFTVPSIDTNTNMKTSDQSVVDVSNTNETVTVTFSEELISRKTDVVCKRCGRVLTDTESRILGMGPTCYKLYMAERNKQLNLFCRKDLGKKK